jgi:hypothetical protein
VLRHDNDHRQPEREGEKVMSAEVIDLMSAPRAFVRVYRCPEKLTDGYCFGGGQPITFTNVDWFETLVSEGRKGLEDFIRSKRYFDPKARFLVLADHRDLTFTIDPAQPS